MYFTDPPYGLPKNFDDPRRELDFCGVYRLSKAGELTLLTKELTRPNGIAFSPDEKTLYVAQSDPAAAIWMAFDGKSDGTLGKGRKFFDATAWAKEGKKGLPDGMRVDAAGNLFATGPGGVLVFAPDGKHLGTIATGVPTASHDDEERLLAAAKRLAALDGTVASLEACGLPATLVHGDEHGGNVIATGGRLVVLDWGDSFVGHPVHDIVTLAGGRGDERADVVAAWCALWRRSVPGCDPERAREIGRPLSALRSAAVYAEFLDRIEVGADVIAHGRVRTAAGLHGRHPVGVDRAAATKEVGILGRVDVVGDHGALEARSEFAAQGGHAGRPAAAQPPSVCPLETRLVCRELGH